ncbi:hypothetical protein [Acetobacter aceti]|uniref:hypothetical protein n=1 Tax=Acetobacter aceti TaxID=435 RepID=UPI000C07AF35|nr:hypothetical protein [Acetobacter aceti]
MKNISALVVCAALLMPAAAFARGFVVPGAGHSLDATTTTPDGIPLFDGAGRPTGPMSPTSLYAGMVSGATISSTGAYAPSDLPVTLTFPANNLGETAAASVTAYTAVSARVASAGNNCPAPSVFTIAETGTKIIVSDGAGLSGSVVTVSVGGSGTTSAIPTNPVTPTTTASGCTPPTFSLSWGVSSISLDNQGWGYFSAPTATGSVSTAADAGVASISTTLGSAPVNLANKLVAASRIGAAGGVAGLDNSGSVASPVSGSVSAASAQAAYSGSVGRTISQRWGDRYNLADLGAKLDGSASDAATIQSIYNTLPSNSLVEVPRGSRWDGKLAAPNPNKYVTWLFDGSIAGYYPSPGGDGDINITLNGGFYAGAVSKSSKHFNTPASAFFWNMNPGFCGPFCSNYMQMPAFGAQAISGPTSSGNTSAINAELDSYGNGPSSSYDVGINSFVKKMGQNSVWGIVDDIQDFSAKSPGAFASWNEFDLWANGQDILEFDPSYGTPQSGHRSLFYVSGSHLNAAYWSASQSISAWSTGQYDKPDVTRIQVGVNGVAWLWYAQKSGTTGSAQPNFPAPTEAVASYDGATTLTVSSVVSGTISAGDYVTAAQPVHPFQIVKQLTGTTGGAGTYQIALDAGIASESAFASEGVYIAPRVTDGTAVWQFGELYNQTIGSVLWLTGALGDSYDTPVGGDSTIRINNAWLDGSNSQMGPTAAVVRAASGQVAVDFTANGTQAGRNQHTLSYSTGLAYSVGGAVVHRTFDDGIEARPVSVTVAAGTTIANAASASGPYVLVKANADNSGVTVSSTLGNAGASQTIMNISAHSIYVYPINSSWAFYGKSVGAGTLLLPYSSVTAVNIGANLLFAEYHPAAP